MGPSIRQTDIDMKYPRVEILGHYSMPPPKEDFDAILGLVKWCNETYLALKKHSNTIKKVSEYTTIDNRKMPPKCMIPAEILNQQLNELAEFRQRNK
jgi:hypothetical protein